MSRTTYAWSALAGAALVALTAGCASAAPAAPAALAVHQVRSASPVASAGLGWSVAEYSASTQSHSGRTTLYAVSPQGRTYAIYSWTPTRLTLYYLVDWSGDGQRVLLRNASGRSNQFEEINVVTGKVVSKFTLPQDASVIGYTRPDGENILAVQGLRIVRYNLEGQFQKTLVTTGGTPIESPDGTTVIVGGRNGIEQVSNLGGVIKRLRPPVPVLGCTPVRWWSPTTVLAFCGASHGSGILRLWLFPVNGGRVRALTAQRNNSIDLGDIDGWQLTSGVYTQALGACGTEFIAKQWRNGSAHEVTIPGVDYDNVHIYTGHGSSLLVAGRAGCGEGKSLFWFNPGTGKVTFVLRATGTTAGVVADVPFGRPLS